MSVVARYAFLLVALAYEVFLGNAAGQAIQNGDFEDVTIGSESSSMPSDVPGWTHSGSVGDHLLWRTGYSDPDGSVVRAGRGAQFVTLGGGYWARGSASWSTTISGLRPGRWYELSFMISNENQRKEPLTLSVSFPSGAAAAPRSFSAKASTGYWSAWEFEEQTFRATQATAVVMFSVDNQRYDIGLDNVSVRYGISRAVRFTMAGSMVLILR